MISIVFSDINKTEMHSCNYFQIYLLREEYQGGIWEINVTFPRDSGE